MKFQVLSDLHIDSYARRGLTVGEIVQTDADVVLVAGDTCNGSQGMAWLQQQAQQLDKPIVSIAGNHEYFGQDIASFDAVLAQFDNYDTATGRGLKVLQCQSIDFAQVRVLGCTLWTDYQFEFSEQTLPMVLRFMRDYQQIYVGEQLFSPEVSVQIHHQQRRWLQRALQQAHKDQKTCVVMSHHSVTPLSVSEKYADLPSNAAFVSDLSDWMQQPWAPKLWIHGHTHEAFDYQLGNTRVVVNPRAYPGEVSSTPLPFTWDKVVAI